MELVYIHPQGLPYGGSDFAKRIKDGTLDVCFAGIRAKVRLEGSRFLCSVPDIIEGHRADIHGAPHGWFPTGVATARLVDDAAQAALRLNAQEAEDRRIRDQGLIEEALVKAADAMGLLDRDDLPLVLRYGVPLVVQENGMPMVQGAEEVMAKFKAAKPHFFAKKPGDVEVAVAPPQQRPAPVMSAAGEMSPEERAAMQKMVDSTPAAEAGPRGKK
jgi:hypothetical protein